MNSSKSKKKTTKKTTKKIDESANSKKPIIDNITNWLYDIILSSHGASMLLCFTCKCKIEEDFNDDDKTFIEYEKHLHHVKYRYGGGLTPLETIGAVDLLSAIKLNAMLMNNEIQISSIINCNKCGSKIEPDSTKCMRCNNWHL